jgi:hypothetical protein
MFRSGMIGNKKYEDFDDEENWNYGKDTGLHPT